MELLNVSIGFCSPLEMSLAENAGNHCKCASQMILKQIGTLIAFDEYQR